jgi:hypothetical protein
MGCEWGLQARFVRQCMDVHYQIGTLIRRKWPQSRINEPVQPRAPVVAVELDDRISTGEALGSYDLDRGLRGVTSRRRRLDGARWLGSRVDVRAELDQ